MPRNGKIHNNGNENRALVSFSCNEGFMNLGLNNKSFVYPSFSVIKLFFLCKSRLTVDPQFKISLLTVRLLEM